MRAESSTSVAPIFKRVLGRLAVAKRSVWARGPVVRWLAVLGTVAAVGGFSYLATLPAPGKNLGEGRQYSLDAIARITRALESAHIEHRVEDGRIGVAADDYDEATDVVSKLEIDHRSIAEIRKEAQVSSLWESRWDKEQRELRAREEILETMIGGLDGIVSAFVTIKLTPTRVGGRPTMTTTASVWLETKDSREIGPKTVQSIKRIIVANEPSLKADAVAVLDRKGRQYLDPGNPALDELSRTRAREEELAQEILEQMDWVRGARVTVQMVAPPAPEPVAAVTEKAPPPPAGARVGVNQPLEDPAQEPALVAEPGPAAEPRPAPEPDFARVWVQVPRTFYSLKAWPNRNPSQEELQAIQARTEGYIKRAVGYVLPSGTFEVSVDTLPDDPPRDPLVASPMPELRRIPSWWIPAAVGGGVAAMLLLVGLGMLATRRPRRRAAAADPARVRFSVEAAPESGQGRGASERVRELIRHNPEAAAGVLHRWIGQGGHAA